jgi:hypothetical protein
MLALEADDIVIAFIAMVVNLPGFAVSRAFLARCGLEPDLLSGASLTGRKIALAKVNNS